MVEIGSSEQHAEEGTRRRVASALLQRRAATAAELGADLGLTPAGIRRHLAALVTDGLAEPTDAPVPPGATRGRGRPARAYRLTDAGRELFDQAYDDLATSLLRHLEQTGGDEAVRAFARQRVHELETRYASALRQAEGEQRPRVLAEALTADGYAANVRSAPHGAQVCQHHCPVAHVAEAFPQFCEAETEVFARLLGRPVQRLATIARGDGICTTHVPQQHSPEHASPEHAANPEHASPQHAPQQERTPA